ncbi:MAG: NAD(+) diphosphatase [Burkholderiaceae bacterium]|nr:NAD(+) diphosphatase [Burkholderiaceae bacterium]
MIITPPGFEPAHQLALDDDAIAYVFVRDALVQFGDSPGALPWKFYREVGLVAVCSHSIGRHEGRAHIAVALAEAPVDTNAPETLETWSSAPPVRQPTPAAALPEGLCAAGLRSWFGVLDDATLAIAMRAVQLVEWDRTQRFCGACGTPTQPVGNERAKRCPCCGLTAYPRIAPAMMVQVTRGRELLLGRGVNFPPGRYSALAGFVEAGESIEDAIHREVYEEVGLRVGKLRYFGSQTWPFPNSLMIAFQAEYAGGELRPDPAELADAQWFAPDALPQLPPRVSIARALIEDTIARIGG